MAGFCCAHSKFLPAVVCVESTASKTIAVRNYDLAATLSSGQAFRWRRQAHSWVGVISGRWVKLTAGNSEISVSTADAVDDWDWLTDYLQTEIDLKSVLESFPKDGPMRAAVEACRGLRLLRQDPWECLASFILSSTKQIVQIQQIIGVLCRRFGAPVAVGEGHEPDWAFPSPERLAAANETQLRACKMGFRAPYLLSAARAVAEGNLDLNSLRTSPIDAARSELVKLRGVGEKVSNCVLLFAFGRQEAFPVDVWVAKALRQLYFPRRKPNLKQLQAFAWDYFAPNAGYAQQYLFHYMRTKEAMDRPLR
jgi:N-glycosylase/DNA lyase